MNRARIVCHRGLAKAAPENTLAALEAAIASSADGIEIDIRTSRDGVLYVFHDATLERTSDGHGAIAGLTASEIDALDAGGWFSPAFAGLRIPRLSAFLDACRGRIQLCLDLKDADPERVRDMLNARGLLASSWCFAHDDLVRVAMRMRVPDLPRMLLFSQVGSVERAVASGARVLGFLPQELTLDRVLQAREAGVMTQVFYTGSDEAVLETIVRCDVDLVNLDEPELFRSIEARVHARAA